MMPIEIMYPDILRWSREHIFALHRRNSAMKSKINILPQSSMFYILSSVLMAFSIICVAVFLNKHVADEQLGKFKCKMQAIKKVSLGWMCCITLQHAVLRWCWLTHEDDEDNMQWDEEGWKRTKGKPSWLKKVIFFTSPSYLQNSNR